MYKGRMRGQISFKCRACKWDSAETLPALHAPPWAQVSGFDSCVRWLVDRPGPAPAGQTWSLDRAPARGEKHWLEVSLPFHAMAEVPFWCLYQPPHFECAGGSDYANKLAHSAIVRCTMLEVHDTRPERARVLVTIEEVLAVNEIGSLFPATGRIRAGFWQEFPWPMEAACWNDFRYVEGNLEGDVVIAALFRNTGGEEHLILKCRFSTHSNFFFAGNSPVDREAMNALESILSREGR